MREGVQAAQARGSRTSGGEVLLKVRNLRKYFPVHGKGFLQRVVGTVKAVDDVSFEMRRGEMLGLVGESGSGKTTAARAILRALKPTSGSVMLRTESGWADLARLPEPQLKRLRPRMQMIFQDPFSSLNPRMTVGRIVGEPLVVHNVGTSAERRDRVREILVRVGLMPEHAIRYPHAFSGGQRQRIGIARALILRPELVIADESVSALDVSVQAQVINLLGRLKGELALTCLFVAHDLSVVRHICDRVAVMYAGRLVELGDTGSVFDEPLHPYTQSLISAVPHPDPDRKMNFKMPGEVADPANLPPGCSFHPRCAECMDACRAEFPPMREVSPGRYVACLL